MGLAFYYWHLNKPIKKLKKAIQKIENGQLDFQFKHSYKGELGQTCGAFEKMRQSLAKNILLQ
ncbi:hypothetical protein AZF37_06370 [endosymbiont 'TC1' of Trimyema compressum]|uniref:HAMP domain-containing protein n=1 Tax=endosymbiont 'TC1' of Trimyema compressum TaxID=243899 RepID=UPI0007F0AC26|nr:HAMP domain-containing protein [endosymbiont 'TC1' of Trimyema compressum]AMP20846.1 hypothetical protein AZF37_06370 [endosymbiont 'TC1' of Trimyema compressum]